jgi:phosphoenolpyruvate-protein kinase (PTS system EI component)
MNKGQNKFRIEKAIDNIRQGLNNDAKQMEGQLGKQSGDIFLTQYTMAAGRENPPVAEYFIDDHPTILGLIEMVIGNPVTLPCLFVGSSRAGSILSPGC